MEAKYHIVIYPGIGVTIQQKALNKKMKMRMESFYKRDVPEKCYRASYMTMLNIQIIGEE